MPRYFFDTDDNDTLVIDDEGQELPDDDAARRSVLAALPDMAREKMLDGDRRTFRASARNTSGQVVYAATMTVEGSRAK